MKLAKVNTIIYLCIPIRGFRHAQHQRLRPARLRGQDARTASGVSDEVNRIARAMYAQCIYTKPMSIVAQAVGLVTALVSHNETIARAP